LAARRHELFLAQHGELLRERGLAHAERLLQLADAALALGELAQDHQPVRVRQRLHQAAGILGGALHGREVDGAGNRGHGFGPLHRDVVMGSERRYRAAHYIDSQYIHQYSVAMRNPERPTEMKPRVQPFFDPATWTISYVVYEREGSPCAIVDSVLDYDPRSGRTATDSADAIAAFVRERQLSVEWILETHAHADHLSAAPYLRRQLGGKIAIGEAIRTVQGVFKKVFNLEPEFRLDGS